MTNAQNEVNKFLDIVETAEELGRGFRRYFRSTINPSASPLGGVETLRFIRAGVALSVDTGLILEERYGAAVRQAPEIVQFILLLVITKQSHRLKSAKDNDVTSLSTTLIYTDGLADLFDSLGFFFSFEDEFDADSDLLKAALAFISRTDLKDEYAQQPYLQMMSAALTAP